MTDSVMDKRYAPHLAVELRIAVHSHLRDSAVTRQHFGHRPSVVKHQQRRFKMCLANRILMPSMRLEAELTSGASESEVTRSVCIYI